MTGYEVLVVGYLVARSQRRLRHIGDRVESEADAAAHLLLDRLHEVVANRLSDEPDFITFEQAMQNSTDVNDSTIADARRVVADAVLQQPKFGAQLSALTNELQTI